MTIINKYLQKIKHFITAEERSIILALLIAGTGLGAYGLGFISGQESLRTHQDYAHSQIVHNRWMDFLGKESREASFVASRKGTKYYKIHCSQAKRIKEENRVYFRDETRAEALGFERGSC